MTALATIVLLSASDVFGQAASFGELEKLLKPGERIAVIRDKNDTATGRLVDMSDSAITVMLADKTSRTFQVGDVSVVERRDALGNGALRGFWWGLVAAGVPIVYFGGICHQEGGIVDCLPALMGIGLVGGSAGAGIGAVVDALLVEVVYRQSNRVTRFSIQPAVTMGPQGIRASLSVKARPCGTLFTHCP
jgi:hypothetical protein